MFRRKIIWWAVVVIVLLIVGLFLTTFLFREAVCQGKHLPFMREWVQLLTPPKDLYRRVVDENLNISTVGNKTIVFTLKYIGPYSIQLALKPA